MDTTKFDLLKSHIDAFTRKDGSVVAAHDDKRQAAQSKTAAPMSADAVQNHAVESGAKHKSSVQVFSQKANAMSFANRAMNSKGSAFVMKHPDHAHHVVVGGADAQRMQKNGYHFADEK